MPEAARLDELAFSFDNALVILESTTDVKTKATETRLAEDGSSHLSGDSFFMLEKVK